MKGKRACLPRSPLSTPNMIPKPSETPLSKRLMHTTCS